MPIDPIAQQLLEDVRRSGRPNAHLLPVQEARRNYEQDCAALAKPNVQRVVDVSIGTRDGDTLPARLYLPADADDLPVTLYFHGGGWLLGSIESHDVVTRHLANASHGAVLSVGYRRGPESRFPTAVNDGVDALHWTLDHGAELPVDTSRVAVAGDSAGGNLAAAVALHARDRGWPRLRHQLLVYPVTTTDLGRGMDREYDGVVLERDELQWHQDNYLPGPDAANDQRINVLDANLTGLPEATIILAECDPIRPQGELFAKALRAAGVSVQTHLTPGMVHGFFGYDEVFPTATPAMEFAGARLARALRR
jgi:acetyl esterase